MPNLAQKARDGRIDALKATVARRNLLLGADVAFPRANHKSPLTFQSIRGGMDDMNLFIAG